MRDEEALRSSIRGSTAAFSVALAAFGLLVTGLPATPLGAQQHEGMGRMEMMKQLVKMAPARGYLKAHSSVTDPPGLLGGPLRVSVEQTDGGVFVALPDNRELDENVFGVPGHARTFAGTPGINGVPPAARGEGDGEFTQMQAKSPFGDAHVVLPGGRMSLEVVDATATDAAESSDEVRFTASWEDRDGNTYEVRCCRMLATHGVEFPTFGGVVTNHLLHGFTRLGTGLMPTEFVYAAFWGMGSVSKNGEVLDRPRLVHGMLTEYVRTDDYQLAEDAEVTPTRRHFHLMVPPFMPNMEEGSFQEQPVKTGMELPNGMELPFWHVMFESLEIEAERTRGS